MHFKYTLLCGLFLLTATSSGVIQGQDGGALIATVAQEMGIGNLQTISLSGAGTTATVGQNVSPDTPWPLVQVKSYTLMIDLDAVESNLQTIEIRNRTETSRNHVIPRAATWAQQFEFWVTPYGLLKGALSKS